MPEEHAVSTAMLSPCRLKWKDTRLAQMEKELPVAECEDSSIGSRVAIKP